MDCFKLISEVKKRPVLWDTTVKMSDRKTIFASGWMDVARKMNMEVEATRKRWKSLRDHYRTEIRRMQQRQSSTTTWKFFQVMDFLRPIFDPNKIVCFDPEKCDLGFEVTISHGSDGDKTSIDLNEPIRLVNDDSFGFDVIDEDIFNQTNDNNTSRACSPTPAKRTRNTQTSDVAIQNTSNNNFQKQNKELVEKDNYKADSDFNFLVSMLPHMNSLSDMGNLKFRMEVSKLLIDLKQSEMGSKSDEQAHEKTKFVQSQHEMRPNNSQQSGGNPQYVDVLYLKSDDSKYNGYLASDFLEFELKTENDSEIS